MHAFRFMRGAVAAATVLFAATTVAGHPPAEPIDNAGSVQAAIEAITDRLRDQGLEIVLVVDHQASAMRVGLELRPTQVVFARPPKRLERRLLKRNAVLGLDLPLKFLVYEDANGDLQLRYNPIGYLLDRHDLTIKDGVLTGADRLIEQFGELDNGIVRVESDFDRETTVQNALDAIGGTGAFGIPLVLDYGSKTGCTLIVFGNPNAGTPLMQVTQEVALDLPQKFLVCAERHHGAAIYYNDPVFIGKRHNVQGQDMRLAGIANALRSFANAAAGK